MKAQIPKTLLDTFIAMAKTGEGRETDAGGGNTKVDITIMRADLAGFPVIDSRLEGLIGGTIRVYLNREGRYVGHKFLPAPKKHRVAS